MHGGGVIVAGKFICLVDLTGVDGPDVFQAQCEDLSDLGSVGPEPIDLAATLSGGAPSSGITFNLTNNTTQTLNGSVNVRITRATPSALTPFLNGL